jgi:cysteinyl-tRNA synthetase
MAVAPARCAALDWPAEPTTLRFALAKVPYAWPLDVTDSLLEHSEQIMERWRDHVDEWSHHPGRPIPSAWRTRMTAALDDDLDAARLVATMQVLATTEVVEPGAKFEAFAYLDRVLAVDLMRNLGRVGAVRKPCFSAEANTEGRICHGNSSRG